MSVLESPSRVRSREKTASFFRRFGRHVAGTLRKPATAPALPLLAIAAFAACEASPPTQPKPRAIVLIGIDTLRADHLGLYGAKRPTSPFLDRIAEDARVFDRAYATSSWTLPSFASMLTGLDPAAHGAGISFRRDPEHSGAPERKGPRKRTKLDPAISTLAERLNAAGFATLAVVQSPNLHPVFGLDRGFDVYDHIRKRTRRARASVQRALALIDEHKDRPFFLFVHLIDPHLSYNAPAPVRGTFTREIDSDLELPVGDFQELRRKFPRYSAADRRFIEAAYDEEIVFVDQQIERLLRGLRQRGLEEQMLVILTADHGEEFLDHGAFEHGHTLYDELIRVPFMVWGQGITPKRESVSVSIADVAPTILDAVGLKVPEGAFGISLWPLLSDRVQEPKPRLLVAEGILYGPELRTAIRWPYKLVERPSDGQLLLFDLEKDPEERTDLSETHSQLALELRAELERRLSASATGTHREAVELDAQMIEDLRELGYVE